MRSFAGILGLFAVPLVLVTPAVASADVVERARSVDVVLHRTYADVSVMVSLSNEDETWSLQDTFVTLGGGFITNLSVLSAPTGGSQRGAWRPTQLTDSAVALGLMQGAFDGIEAGAPTVVHLAWEDATSSRITASIRGKETTSLAYKITVPIGEREQGRASYVLEGFGNPDGMTHLRLADGLTGLEVDGVRSPDGAAAIESAAGHVVRFDVPVKQTIAGDIAVLPATDAPSSATPGAQNAVVDAWFDTADQLGAVPEDARVVVVLDGSKSIEPADRDGMLGAARAYVSHFEAHHGEVAIVTFDRRASASAFMGAKDAGDAISALVTRAPANGSNVDAGLAEAGRLLASVAGPKRVVVFSDLETADRIDPSKLDGVLPKGTLLHVVQFVGASSAMLSRDDESPWSALSRGTGGLAWSAYAMADMETERTIFEELARPKRLDHARMTAFVEAEGDAAEEELGAIDEGKRFSRRVIGAVRPASFTVEGELWSAKVSQTIAGTSGYRKLAAGAVFTRSGYLADQIDPGRRKELAWFAHALTPDTSFVLVEGKGSSDYGSPSGDPGHLGGSHRALAPKVRIGIAKTNEFDFVASLEKALKPLATACGADPGALRVRVETTEEEVVDVGVEGAPGTAIESCVVEAAWLLELDPMFGTQGHKTWSVSL
jgi:hypothetical protein